MNTKTVDLLWAMVGGCLYLLSVVSAQQGSVRPTMQEMMQRKIAAHEERAANGAANMRGSEQLNTVGALKCNPFTRRAGEGVFDFECKNMHLHSVVTGPELGSGYFNVFGGTETFINDIWVRESCRVENCTY